MPARGAPLLITAELPPDVHGWAERLRRAHYPPERNRMAAHVTLFHGLPPSADEAVRRLLAELTRASAPQAAISGLMDLGRGTAFLIDSPALQRVHAELAERLHGLIQQRDAQPPRFHVTVQNKLQRQAALMLQEQLARDLGQPPRRRFPLRGLALHVWRDELWRLAQRFPFRGQAPSGG